MNGFPGGARETLLRTILDNARGDPRIVGVVDYGSSAAGRADQWSDLDLVLFIANEQHAPFASAWKNWAQNIGALAGHPALMTYQAGAHPRAVYEATQAPLRVDLAFHPAARIPEVATWKSIGPTSIEAMILWDPLGQLTQNARGLVGLEPADFAPQREFEHVGGDLWNYLLRVYALMQRAEMITARIEYAWYVLDGLAALMRLEAHQPGRWRLSLASNRLKSVASPQRLSQLRQCVPGKADADLALACHRATQLGVELCDAIALAEGWEWPRAMGLRCKSLFAIASDVAPDST